MTVLLLGDVGRQTGNFGDVEAEGETGIVQFIETKPLRLEGVVARDGIPRQSNRRKPRSGRNAGEAGRFRRDRAHQPP
ncbi:hypothetical protein [Propylenella binzhouense]|uniref:hypothetical protein n=1 Tax=Propylenella binzhouense TaxID=2555902 RepID=UPI0019675A45|nr:hypothetical protein [Propylenella binzhouense]